MYQQLIYSALINAFLGTILALLVWGTFRYFKNSQLASILWIIVFLKFISPTFIEIPLLPVAGNQQTHPEADHINSEVSLIKNIDVNKSKTLFQNDSLIDDEMILEEYADIQNSGNNNNSKENIKNSHKDQEFEYEDSNTSVSLGVLSAQNNMSSSNTDDNYFLSKLDFWFSIFVVWMIGTVVYASVMFWRGRQFGQLIRQMDGVEHSLQNHANEIAQKMGMNSAPKVKVLDSSIIPMIWAFGRKPLVLLPAKLIREVSSEKQSLILAHELAHVKRKDHLFRWVELAVLVLFWWFPVIRWIRKQWHIVQEECCDAWVIHLYPKNRIDYGETLLQTVQLLQKSRTTAPVWANELWKSNILKGRIETMLERKNVTPLSRSLRYATLLILGPLLAFSVGQVQEEQPNKKNDEVLEIATAFQKTDDKPTVINQNQESKNNELQKPRVIKSNDEEDDDYPVRQKISGRITDPNGQPIENAYVFWGYVPAGYKLMDIDHTDSNGNYNLSGVRPGHRVVYIFSKNWAPKLVSLYVSKNMPELNIQLEKGRKLEFHLKDQDGKSLSGVTFFPDKWKTDIGNAKSNIKELHYFMKEGLIPQKSDKNGNYVWENAPVEPFEYSFRKKGYVYSHGSADQKVKGVLQKTLLKPKKLVFHVVDSITGQPISETSQLSVYTQNSKNVNGMDVSINTSRDLKSKLSTIQFHTNSFQKFPAFQIQHKIRPTGLQNNLQITDTCFVEVYNSSKMGDLSFAASGYVTQNINMNEFANKKQINGEYIIKLGPSKKIIRKVVYENGAPVTGADVLAFTENTAKDLNPKIDFKLIGQFPNNGYLSRTDKDGMFEFSSGVNEFKLLIHHKDGSAILNHQELYQSDAPIVLKPYGGMQAKILIEDRPAKNVKVRITRHKHARDLQRFSYTKQGGRRKKILRIFNVHKEIKVNSNGVTEISNFPEGVYVMWINYSQENPKSKKQYSNTTIKVFEVKSGEITHLEVGEKERKITGKVKFKNKNINLFSTMLIDGKSMPISNSKYLKNNKKQKMHGSYGEGFQSRSGINNNGTFVFYNVPVGRSTIGFQLRSQVDGKSYIYGSYTYTFDVPAVKNGQAKQTIDLGELVIADHPVKNPEVSILTEPADSKIVKETSKEEGILNSLVENLQEKDKEKREAFVLHLRLHLLKNVSSKSVEKIVTVLLKALHHKEPQVRLIAADLLGLYIKKNDNEIKNVIGQSTTNKFQIILDSLVIKMNQDSEPMMKYVVSKHLNSIETRECAAKLSDTFYQSDGIEQYYSLGSMRSMSVPWNMIREYTIAASRRNHKEGVNFWKKYALKYLKIACHSKMTDVEYEAAFRFCKPELKVKASMLNTKDERLAYFKNEMSYLMTLVVLLSSSEFTEAFVSLSEDATDEQIKVIKDILKLGFGENKYGRHIIVTEELADQAIEMIGSENKGAREVASIIIKHKMGVKQILFDDVIQRKQRKTE